MCRKFCSIGLLFMLAALGPPAAAQLKMVPIGELTDSMRLHPRPALILISTDWCAYCRMQRAQLKKSGVLQRVAPAVYFSEFDAETEDDVVFNDTTYRFIPTGVSTGSHELAFALGSIDSRLAFPTWVLLNENLEIVFQYPGVIKADELTALLKTVRCRPPVECRGK